MSHEPQLCIPRRVRQPDGCVHFSDLKMMSRSPAHYVASVTGERGEVPRSRRIGTIVHQLVLGPRPGKQIACFPGKDRRAKGYAEFCVANPHAEIMTAAEWEDAEPIAAAVLEHDGAKRLLDGAHTEVPLKWRDAGVDCATGGVDILTHRFVADLKTTTNTQPDAFARQAFSMLYHCQLAHVGCGARLNGWGDVESYYLIGVEVEAPYAVTVLTMTNELHDLGRRSVVTWLERLKLCEENDHWPAYGDTPSPFDLPPWMTERNDDA